MDKSELVESLNIEVEEVKLEMTKPPPAPKDPNRQVPHPCPANVAKTSIEDDEIEIDNQIEQVQVPLFA